MGVGVGVGAGGSLGSAGAVSTSASGVATAAGVVSAFGAVFRLGSVWTFVEMFVGKTAGAAGVGAGAGFEPFFRRSTIASAWDCSKFES